MIGFGLRLAALGGRWTIVPAVLTTVAVALGTAILLLALSFQPALEVRYDRGAWRGSSGPVEPAAHEPGMLLLRTTADYVEGRAMARVDVAGIGPDALVPPGIPRVPAPGESFVSPALAELITQRPTEELGDRFGTVVGTVDEESLRAPNELLVINGAEVSELQARGAAGISAFATDGEPPDLGWAITVLVVITVVGALAPVAVFVASATRLAAARRERRLVALRLCGATPAQVAVLAAVDALIITLPGAILGVGAFFAIRPVVARFGVDDLTWFPDAVIPPLLPAIGVVAAVPIVGVVASVIVLRRMSISPLGVARRVGSGPPSRWRVVPVVVALAAFAALLAIGETAAGQDPAIGSLLLIGLALSFFGLIVGILVLGPLLTAAVGRLLAGTGGPVRVLAGRRLQEDPRGSFIGVAGVLMAVFVASAFFGVVAFTDQLSDASGFPVPPSTIVVDVPPAAGTAVESAVAAALDVPGAGPAAVVRRASVVGTSAADPDLVRAWVVRCEDFVVAARLADARCVGADVHLVAPGISGLHDASIAGHPVDADAKALRGEPTLIMELAPALTVGRLLPAEAGANPLLPELLIEPSVVADEGRGIQAAFLLVGTNGAQSTVERVRTALDSTLPAGGPATGAEIADASTRIVDELGRIVSLGLVMTMAVAGTSLAIAVTGGLLDRRRSFALLRLSGVPLGSLRSVLLLEAAAPLVSVAVVSGVLGVAASQILLRAVAADGTVPLPDASLVLLLLVGVGAALAVVAATLPLVGPLTDVEETRFE